MSPPTKLLLMQKLKEVQEQASDSDSSIENYVDGVVAGSTPDPILFSQSAKKKLGTQYYDKETGAIV